MTVKHIFLALSIAILASIGWRYANVPAAQDWISPKPTPQVNIPFERLEPTRAGPPVDAAPPASNKAPLVNGMRKCKRGREVIYTDGDCPTGAREQQMQGGSVTVVPGQEIQQKSEPSARPKNVRDLLTDPKKDAELRERMMDRTINR